MIKIVSSMSLDGFKLYGKQFLKSWIEHWPKDCELHVYIEGPKKQYNGLPIDKRIKYHNLFKVEGVLRVLEAMSVFPVMRGVFNPAEPQAINYRYNIFQFCRKVFAQSHAALDHKDLLFWVDADTTFNAPVTEGWLRGHFQETIQGSPFMIYMDRPHWDHSCASFVGWDCAQGEWNAAFWMNYLTLITHGRFLVLPEWHDSYLLDVCRKQMSLPAVDIAAGLTDAEGPVNIFDLVFKGKGKHFKGNKKFGPRRYQQLIDIVAQMKPETVIEVGTWNGHRAIEMNQAAPGLEYIGFDLFELATAITDEEEKNVKPHHEANKVAQLLGENGVNALLVAGNTNETFPQFIADNPDKQADLIYIDGGHAVDTIRSDFNHALQVIKPGGVIVFDDYYEDMSTEELELWGCNRVLEESGRDYTVLPIADPVKGGGVTKMAVMQC